MFTERWRTPTSRSTKLSHGWLHSGRRGQFALALATLYAGALVALSLLQHAAPRRSGVLALAAVLAPYLFLPLGAALPLLRLRGTAALRFLLVACLVCGLQFFPRLPIATVAAKADEATLTVMTWNVASSRADRWAIQRFVESRPADIVALEEDFNSWWDPDYATWVARMAALERVYPYQIRSSRRGLTILSVYPILAQSPPEGERSDPRVAPIIWGRFDLGQGGTVVVVVAHLGNPTRVRCDPWKLCYDPAVRDAQVGQVNVVIAPFLARGEPVLLAGDLNLTEREPAYRDLTHDLWDAHRQIGIGMGHTWRPFPLAGVGLPLLRIDYLLGNPAIRPLRLTVNCPPRSADHCALRGDFAVRRQAAYRAP